jgi:hypothetical protein
MEEIIRFVVDSGDQGTEFLQTAVNESALVNATLRVSRIVETASVGGRRNKVAGELIDLLINPLVLSARPQSRAWYFFSIRDAQMYGRTFTVARRAALSIHVPT